ncbi:MAG: hypothetical protein M1820_001348 [Bogoriella megaspora]|nr:MAG: hypothetical protein M1820_001348 [Bogoriella megaspora]
MGLEEFSKNQRRNAENAKCEVCVREQVEMAPGDVEEEKSDSDENYDSDDSFYGSYVPGTTQQASFSAPSTKATPVPGRSVWEEQARAGTASQTASTRASRHGMPSSGGADSAMSSTSRHTTASSVVTGKSGWAKVKAKKPEPVFAQLEEDSDEGPAAGDSDDEEEELICL